MVDVAAAVVILEHELKTATHRREESERVAHDLNDRLQYALDVAGANRESEMQLERAISCLKAD